MIVGRAWAAPLLAGVLALAGAGVVALRSGVPRPVYHDELSYLLGADTFARGRLANPTHPMWQHFESFYVLQRPTYASKYPPGQASMLALGQVLGAPIIGVWLSAAALCAAIVWMLRAFVPARWALFGGLLTVVQIAVLSYWGRSYWGGALAAAGGAMVFGAMARIVDERSARSVSLPLPVMLGAGLVVLANTRPFEGALVSLAAAVPLGAWFLRVHDRRARWLRVALPLIAVLGVGVAWMGLYNRAVTGDPLRMPFALYDEQYHVRPLFVWGEMRPVPEYRHEILRRYLAGVEVHEIEDQETLAGWAWLRLRRLERTRAVLLGPMLTVPLLFVPWVRRARGVRLALGGVGLLLVAVAVTNHHYAHYAAPAFALVLLLVVQGLRFLVVRARRYVPSRAVAMTALIAAALTARLVLPDPVLAVGAARSANLAKASIESHLEKLGGRHVVFVNHGRYSDVHDEWVWNGADIDARPIVFARAMGEPKDAELRRYYPDRRAWRVGIGVERPGVVDFDEIAAASGGLH